MNKVLTHSILAIMFGCLVYANTACNASAETKNDEPAYKPIVLSEEDFTNLVVDFTSNDKKYKGEKPCIIDFYADWCGPCRRFAPTFEKVAEKYGDKVNFYKVNTDHCKRIAATYSITSIPTLFFFDKKGTLSRAVGVPSEEELENAVRIIMQ